MKEIQLNFWWGEKSILLNVEWGIIGCGIISAILQYHEDFLTKFIGDHCLLTVIAIFQNLSCISKCSFGSPDISEGALFSNITPRYLFKILL